jgi:hypothetical protein
VERNIFFTRCVSRCSDSSERSIQRVPCRDGSLLQATWAVPAVKRNVLLGRARGAHSLRTFTGSMAAWIGCRPVPCRGNWMLCRRISAQPTRAVQYETAARTAVDIFVPLVRSPASDASPSERAMTPPRAPRGRQAVEHAAATCAASPLAPQSRDGILCGRASPRYVPTTGRRTLLAAASSAYARSQCSTGWVVPAVSPRAASPAGLDPLPCRRDHYCVTYHSSGGQTILLFLLWIGDGTPVIFSQGHLLLSLG